MARPLFLLVLTFLLFGCAAPPPTATPMVARKAVDLVPRPKPAPTATPYPSGGLGLWRHEWEERHGPPARLGASPNPRFVTYQGGRLGVSYANDLVWYVEKTLPEPLPLEDARAEGRVFMPPDSWARDSYITRWGRYVDLFQSGTLAARFQDAAVNGEPIDPWRDVEPGTFIVFFRVLDDRVTSLGLSTGNNP